jgi:hypothetical protein
MNATELIKSYGEDNRDFSYANLRSANLSSADLTEADLRYADLRSANLSSADLSSADLTEADLRYANLRNANLSGANLSSADLSGANLRYANLRSANLSSADLSSADLRNADLRNADLSSANLSGANLSSADLSSAKGLLSASKFMADNFAYDTTRQGWIVYKAIGSTDYHLPDYWKIEPGSYLEEIVNPTRTQECGCGVNFATLAWCKRTYQQSVIWECLLHAEDVPDICVPYNTDGKARCGRLELLRIVEDNHG